MLDLEQQMQSEKVPQLVADKIGGRGGVKALASLKIGKFIKVPVIGKRSAVLALMIGEPIEKALFAGIGITMVVLLEHLFLFIRDRSFIGDYVGNLLGTLFFGGGNWCSIR